MNSRIRQYNASVREERAARPAIINNILAIRPEWNPALLDSYGRTNGNSALQDLLRDLNRIAAADVAFKSVQS